MIFFHMFDELRSLFFPKLIEIAAKPIFSVGELVDLFVSLDLFKRIGN